MRLLSFLLSGLLIFSAALVAQVPGDAKLGTNLSGPADWNSELPFVDVFRLSRSWISQREGEGWGKGPELKLDGHGWITELSEGCFAETPLCTIQTGHYPSGEYVILFDGEGEIRLNNTGPAKLDKPGRMTVQVDAKRGGFFLQIRKTNPQNYIRNIRVIMPGFEETYQKEPFHPYFMQRWQSMTCFRFMDWQHTNGSTIVSWADRPKLTDATWTRRGIPLEVMADFCNRMKADAWVCMPHAADDGYVREFAAQMKTLLDPSLKIYVEYSNEVWNSMFESQRHAQRKAKELGMGPADRPWEGACLYYGQRSMEMFKLWEEAMGGADRLVRVLAWQAASSPHWLDGLLLAKVDAKNVDALAIAPYMSMNLGPKTKPSSDEVADWTVEQVLDHVHNKSLPDSIKWIEEAAGVARKYDVKLVCYEAGQHLVGVGGGENNEKLTKLLHEANRHPRMGEAYAKYYKAWEQAGGDLLCNFSSVSNWSKWGSWGLLEWYDEAPESSPKMLETLKWAKSRGQNVRMETPAMSGK